MNPPPATDGPDDDEDESFGDTPDTSDDLYQADLSLDATLEILAVQERRDIISFLRDQPDKTASTDELVEHLVGLHANRTGTVPPHDNMEVRLHHTHMPKLADTGVIEYDERSKMVRYWQDGRLEDWLARIQTEEPFDN